MLKYLKEHTAQIHANVEQQSLAKFIIDHSISLADYQKFLCQNYLFYSTIENELIKSRLIVDSDLNEFLDKSKSHKLEKDLNEIGVKPDDILVKQYDFKINSKNDAIGAIYVSEGSALGGLVIGKHLNACYELRNIKEHYFFTDEVTSTIARWTNFRKVIDKKAEFLMEDKDEILSSAHQTFALFGKITS